MADPTTIGARIRKARTHHINITKWPNGITLPELARLTGVRVEVLERIEADQADASALSGRDLLQLARELDASIDWLLYGRTAASGPVAVFMCSRGRKDHRCKCGDRATKQCDFELSGPKQGQTCDAFLCGRCSVVMGPNRHYCFPHYRRAKQLELERAKET
ncbi:MAG TPA: helix-turn-helix transcriptional regulator [Polyangiales bacterium]|jgi:hypothetical protein|nr:helix-turn-helix transcriptional regulator [Polyangiales bacterium]